MYTSNILFIVTFKIIINKTCNIKNKVRNGKKNA